MRLYPGNDRMGSAVCSDRLVPSVSTPLLLHSRLLDEIIALVAPSHLQDQSRDRWKRALTSWTLCVARETS